MDLSWMAAMVFVAATGAAGLAVAESSSRSSLRLLLVLAGVVLPTALLAGLLVGS
jgi:hypothetical protein